MPSPDTLVGGIPIPVPAGATDQPIVDVTVDGLLGYLGFWVKFALDGKLATMTAPPVPDACPVANRRRQNPSSLVARFNKPALFAWWNGKSVTKPWTTLKDVRQRDIQVLYVFDRIVDADALERYAGLIGAVDAAWNRAISRRAHPSYAPPGCRLGTPIAVALNLNDLSYLGGQEGFLAEQATSSARQAAVQTGPVRLGKGSANGITSGYPSLLGTFRVLEEVGVDTTLDTDAQGDVLFHASIVNGDPASPLALDQRYLESLDAVDPGDL